MRRSSDVRPGIRRAFRLALRRPDLAAAEADEEIALHLELRAEQLVRRGLSPEAARAEAARRFGPPDEARRRLHTTATRRETRMYRREQLDAMWQDLRYAWRGVRRAPGFALVVVATLALGIGAATAVFSVVHGVLLRPLPYPEPDRVAAVFTRMPTLGVARGNVSEPERADVAALPAFRHVAVHAPGEVTVTGVGEPERVRALYATASLFTTLRTPALVGRAYSQPEDRPGGDGLMMLSHGYWQRRFGGDPAVVGRAVTADGAPRTVVGVLPPGFTFADVDVYLPLALDPAEPGSRGAHNFQAVARLAPGVTHAQAAAQLAALTARLRRDHPAAYPPTMEFALGTLPLREALVGDARPALGVLLGVVGLVLLVACANAASLLLVRGEVRARELGLRAALGAGRRRLARQLLTESALLAAAAGALGLGLAAVGVRALLAVNPDALPRREAVAVDGTVAAAALGLSLLTGLLFGALPALQAGRTDLQGLLRRGGRGGTARQRGRLRQGLVVGEIALALVVVVSAGLLLRSFWTLRRVDAGLDPRGVLTLSASLPESRYPQARVAPAHAEILDRIRALPGVAAAGGVGLLPLGGDAWSWDVVVEGRGAAPGASPPSPRPQVLTPGALEAMRATVVRGRGIAAGDGAAAPLAALVNETMARALWPGADPIGKRFRMAGDSTAWASVVGVVRDVRSAALGEAPREEFFVPHAQLPRFAGWTMRRLTLLVRTPGDPALLAAPVRRALRATDPDLAAADVRTMRQVVDRSVAQPRFTMLLLSAFGGAALLLAAVGVYGVVAYAVAQRTRELGVRRALGARPGDLLRLVVRQGLGLAGAGVAVGVVGALAASRLLGALLFGVRAADPLTFTAIPALLLGVALLASVVPARRAMRVDPQAALRAE